MVGQRQDKVILAIDDDDCKDKILYDDKDYDVTLKEFANAGHLSKRLLAVHRTLKDSRYAPAYNLFVSNRALVTELFVLILVGLTYTIGFILSRRFATREIAVGNAHKIVTAEQHLNIFFELGFQQTILSVVNDSFMRFINNFYLFAHLPCSIAFLLWVFFYHKKQYYRFRNSFLLAHIVCILVEVLFPCAPPRMLGELGFVDTMLVYSKADLMTLEEAAGVNPYAAMPSMHFCYAFLVGSWGFALSKKLLHKTLFVCYTFVVFFGVIVTGNHFIADCLAALVINVAGYVVVSNWEHATKIVKHAASSVSTRPNYWWLYILIIFGGFATIIHLSLRAMAFQMQLN